MIKTNLIIFLGFLLMSCAGLSSTKANHLDSTVAQSDRENQGQMLPITAKAYIKDEVIDLEVAVTDEQQAIGLMYRSSLPKNRGMLFPFLSTRYASFWMKNVVIDLDMIFLKDQIVQAVFINVPPCKVDPCPVYGPSSPVNGVIELAGGQAKALGVKRGDKIIVEPVAKP
jgi:uncharacterized membrane protein (UPF0127 family)